MLIFSFLLITSIQTRRNRLILLSPKVSSNIENCPTVRKFLISKCLNRLFGLVLSMPRDKTENEDSICTYNYFYTDIHKKYVHIILEYTLKYQDDLQKNDHRNIKSSLSKNINKDVEFEHIGVFLDALISIMKVAYDNIKHKIYCEDNGYMNSFISNGFENMLQEKNSYFILISSYVTEQIDIICEENHHYQKIWHEFILYLYKEIAKSAWFDTIIKDENKTYDIANVDIVYKESDNIFDDIISLCSEKSFDDIKRTKQFYLNYIHIDITMLCIHLFVKMKVKRNKNTFYLTDDISFISNLVKVFSIKEDFRKKLKQNVIASDSLVCMQVLTSNSDTILIYNEENLEHNILYKNAFGAMFLLGSRYLLLFQLEIVNIISYTNKISHGEKNKAELDMKKEESTHGGNCSCESCQGTNFINQEIVTLKYFTDITKDKNKTDDISNHVLNFKANLCAGKESNSGKNSKKTAEQTQHKMALNTDLNEFSEFPGAQTQRKIHQNNQNANKPYDLPFTNTVVEDRKNSIPICETSTVNSSDNKRNNSKVKSKKEANIGDLILTTNDVKDCKSPTKSLQIEQYKLVTLDEKTYTGNYQNKKEVGDIKGIKLQSHSNENGNSNSMTQHATNTNNTIKNNDLLINKKYTDDAETEGASIQVQRQIHTNLYVNLIRYVCIF